MTTKEFIEKLDKLGYTVYEGDFVLTVKLGQPNSGILIMTVYFDDIGGINTGWNGFDNLLEKDKIELLKLGFDYIITPIADRVEEEKFYWRVKGWQNLSYNECYLSTSENLHEINWVLMYQPYAKPYTQKEYDKMVADGLIADIFEKEAIEN